MKMRTPGEFAEDLLIISMIRIPLAQQLAAAVAVKTMAAVAKSYIGHYQQGWPRLAYTTLHGWHGHPGKIELGYAPPDNPLLRTGAMRASISFTAPVRVGATVSASFGSNSDIAVYQELGTSKMPPRSFIGAAAAQTEADIHKMAGDVAFRTLTSGGKNYHDLMHVLHTLKRAGEKLSDAFGPEDESK